MFHKKCLTIVHDCIYSEVIRGCFFGTENPKTVPFLWESAEDGLVDMDPWAEHIFSERQKGECVGKGQEENNVKDHTFCGVHIGIFRQMTGCYTVLQAVLHPNYITAGSITSKFQQKHGSEQPAAREVKQGICNEAVYFI